RRRRLLKELAEGTRHPTEGMKPIEVLQHVHALLELGETLTSLRKVATVHARDVGDPAQARALVGELQRAYHFRPEAFEFLGLSPEALGRVAADGTVLPRRRGRP